MLVPCRCVQGRLYNTCLVYGPDGALLAKHRKVHLFDIDIPGEITFKESETLTGGDKGTVVDTPVGRIGVGICYDIRFPELAMLYARQGCQMILYPGAFNMTTGPLHWELLQRARAVDNQVFVMTCSPARKNGEIAIAGWGRAQSCKLFFCLTALTYTSLSRRGIVRGMGSFDGRQSIRGGHGKPW